MYARQQAPALLCQLLGERQELGVRCRSIHYAVCLQWEHSVRHYMQVRGACRISRPVLPQT